MAIAHVRSGTGSADNATVSVTLGAAPAEGNLLVAMVSFPSGAETLAATGTWTELTRVDPADKSALYWKVAGAGESATQSPALASDAKTWVCAMAEYSGCATTTPLEAETATSDADATKTTTGTCDPTDGVERLIVVGAASDGNRTFSAQKVNGSTTGDRKSVV